ncbi:MAG TPA: phosphatase PAP2 family protein [Ardenticatenaceae bacterium]|nr:phosphatase PAP2 family protein [Ardenticatenaceae bacterium]
MAGSQSTVEQQRDRVERREERRERIGWLRAMARDEGRRHRFLFAVGVAGLALVAVMALLVLNSAVLPFEVYTTQTFQGIDSLLLLRLMQAVSFPGFFPWNVTMIVLSCLAIARFLGWKDGFYLGAIAATQGIINHLLRITIGRPRPSPELVEVYAEIGSTSFPSGHVMSYVVFFGFLFFLVWTRFPPSPWRTLTLVVLAVLLLLGGPARIYLGAHWITDVAAGYIVGLVILVLAIEVYLRYLAPRRTEEQEGLIGERDEALGK